MTILTIRLTASRNLACWFIRKLTWSEYSHVEIGVYRKGRLGWVGALPEGVVWKPYDYDPHCNYAIATIDCTYEQKAKVAEFIKAQMGKPYDFGAICGIWLHRDWAKPDRWFCSELVAAACRHAGIKLVGDAEMLDRITPRDILYSPSVHVYEVHQE